MEWDEEYEEDCEEDEEEEAFMELSMFFTGLLSMTDPSDNIVVTFDATCFPPNVQNALMSFSDNMGDLSETNWAGETPKSALKLIKKPLTSLGQALQGVAQTGCEAVEELDSANGLDAMIENLAQYSQNPQDLLQLSNNAGYLFEDVQALMQDCAYDA